MPSASNRTKSPHRYKKNIDSHRLRLKLFNFLYRRTFLRCMLYRHTTAYKTLFPKGRFLDPETPYKDEIELIRKAIKNPAYQLEEPDMGIVLSQLIQSNTSHADARKTCATLNSRYRDESHYMIRRSIIAMQLDYFERNTQRKNSDTPFNQ